MSWDDAVPRAALWSRTSAIALTFALVWSTLLLGAALVLPAYSTASQSASLDSATGTMITEPVTTGTETVVGINGPGALIAVGIPFVITLLVGAALAARRRGIGWTLTFLLGFFTLLAMLSIGIFILPTTLALVVACAATVRGRVARPTDDRSPRAA